MAKGSIHLSKMTIPCKGYSFTGKYDADCTGRTSHANPTKKRVSRAIRKAQRRMWNADCIQS